MAPDRLDHRDGVADVDRLRVVDADAGPARLVSFETLSTTGAGVRFEGADHGAEVSVIVVRMAAGDQPTMRHRHPYPEVWIVEQGEATFDVGERSIIAPARHIVVAPPHVPHRFRNTGSTDLHLVSVHGVPRFVIEPV